MTRTGAPWRSCPGEKSATAVRSPGRIRHALAAAALAACAVAAPTPARAADAWVALEGPARVDGLRFSDVDGDGVADVLAVMGRSVSGWRGVRGGVPASKPSWTWTVPAPATFLAPGRVLGEGDARTPTLLALARAEVLRLAPGKPPVVEEGLRLDVPWSDADKAVFADFVHGKALLLPTKDGVNWVPDGLGARATSFELRVPPAVHVGVPGGFVEDAASVRMTWSAPVIVAPGAVAKEGGVAALAADGLHALLRTPDGSRAVRLALAGLPTDRDVRTRLVDFTGDGVPDVVRDATTNDAGTYAFAPVVSLKDGATVRPRSIVKVRGFQIPSDIVDLDGDGKPDFVVTAIEIDTKNVMRAVMKGRVTARTLAFRNRGGDGADGPYPIAPDAEVESDVGVRILFTYSGSIDVQRSFTIVATADLDGDGRKDLAMRTPEGTLAVRRGTASGVWSSDATTLPLPPVGDAADVEARVAEATGDAKDDLLLLYRAPPGGTDRLYLLPSK